MKITKLGLKGHAPTKGSGTTMAEAVTWAESGGKVVVPWDSNNWTFQSPQWLSFVLNAGTTYTFNFTDTPYWLMNGGAAEVKDAGGNTVASIVYGWDDERQEEFTTPAVVTPAATGTYYLYVNYWSDWGDGDVTLGVSVTPEPGSPPSTHFLPWESGFTKKGDAVKTYEDVQSAAISPLMKGSRFASNYFMVNESYGRKVIIILDNKPYWVYNGQCKLIDDSRKYIGMLTTYYDVLVFDADGNMWCVGWTGENEDTRLWSGVVLAMDGTVKFPDFYTYSYIGSDLSKYFLPVLVNNKLALLSRVGSGIPITMKVFEDWPSMRMFSYEKQWSQDNVVCWNLAVGLDNKLYKYKMVSDNDSKCELVDSGRWKIASGAIYYHYNEQGWAVGIKDDEKLYEIYSDYENSSDTAQIRVLDETHTWRWCISSKTPLAITTDGKLYFLGWRGMDSDPHFELENLSTGNCTKAVPCSWTAGNHHAYAIIDGGLYKIVNNNDTLQAVRIGTASDWTDVVGGGFYASDNKERSYGYAVRDNKMYAIKDDSVWELPSFTEYTGSGDSSSSSSGGALPDDSSSSSGSTPSEDSSSSSEGGVPTIRFSCDAGIQGNNEDGSQLPDGYEWQLNDEYAAEGARKMTMSATFTQHPTITTVVDGVTYPVWVAQDGWTATLLAKDVEEDADIIHEQSALAPGDTIVYGDPIYLFAARNEDDPNICGWIMAGSAGGVGNTACFRPGTIWVEDYDESEEGHPTMPDLATVTASDWEGEGGVYPMSDMYGFENFTYVYSAGSGSQEESSSSSNSGGSQPSQSVTKITITSSGSGADGEYTLNPSTGNYEKGGLRLECVQDALYAWQIWDREMPEYPDLYYSTGYTFQTNNVSEVLGTNEWHDVKLDDPITLTLTDTSPNSSGGESSSSSSGAADSSSSSGSTPSSSPSEIIVTATGLTPICTDKTLTIVDPNATGTSRIWRNQHYDEEMYEYYKTEVRYDSASGRWEIYDGQTMGGGENDWMPMAEPIYSETTTADPWTSGLNWYYVDLEVEHSATVTITPANGGSGGTPSEDSSSSESSSSSGGATSGINFTGDYSEDATLHYSGTFLPTEYTITVDEWDNVNHRTVPRAVPLYSGSFHVTGTEMDWSSDEPVEVAVDRYETLWLMPVQTMETAGWWDYETDADKAAALEEEGNADFFPYFAWGINDTRASSLWNVDVIMGYFLRTHCVVPPLANTNSVYSENAGGWDNCTITVS